MKFIRNYRLVANTPAGKQITIEPPFSIHFDVSRDVMSSVNNASITLYNLAPETRDALYKDKYATTELWQLFLSIGYGTDELYEIFRGNVYEAYSYKRNTEWITEMTGYDGSYAIQNGFVSETIASGSTAEDMATRIIHTMPDIDVGALGTPVTSADMQAARKRGTVLLGPSFDVLQEITKGNAYIDSGKVYVMAKDDALSGSIFILDSDLIKETPKRREQFLEVTTTALCPEVRVGYICELQSAFSRYNGQYKVFGVKHSGDIMGSQCGDAESVISLYKGAAAFTQVVPK